MIKDSTIPSRETTPRHYCMYYEYKTGNISLKSLHTTVCYTYEEAEESVQKYIEECCDELECKYYGGDVEIVKFHSNEVQSILNEAFEKYGEPEVVFDPETEGDTDD